MCAYARDRAQRYKKIWKINAIAQKCNKKPHLK